MNLYLFNDNDSAARFGIGTYLNELTNALEGTDIHVHIVHLHSVRPEFVIEKAKKVENWYIPEVHNQNTFDGPIQKIEYYYLNVIYMLRLNIKEIKDLIFHFNFNQCRALAKGIKEVFDCKTVTTVHFMKWALELRGNLTRFQALKSKPESQMNTFEQLLFTTDDYESQLYREVDRVIALSMYTRNLLCDKYRIDPDSISVIPNGLQDITAVLEADRKVLRRKWHISENERLILYAGRLHAAKGLTFLIDAFRKVLDKIPDCRLIIAGSGNFEPYIRASKEICTKATFTGLLEKKELTEFYQMADVGVLPSLFETFSYVAVEMMMNGLPIVTTTTSGLNEVVDEASGIKIPVIEYPDRVDIDTELFAEKIVYSLEHPAEAKVMGQNGRKRYLKEYSSEVFRRNMLHFYTSLF